ncbi:hypothetical protein MTO96_003751 [Rhipicephalus appendiculatus]
MQTGFSSRRFDSAPSVGAASHISCAVGRLARRSAERGKRKLSGDKDGRTTSGAAGAGCSSLSTLSGAVRMMTPRVGGERAPESLVSRAPLPLLLRRLPRALREETPPVRRALRRSQCCPSVITEEKTRFEVACREQPKPAQ